MAIYYINWDKHEILDEQKVERIKIEEYEYDKDDDFDRWLDENFTSYEIWCATEKERKLIEEAYDDYHEDWVNQAFLNDYEMIEI